MTEYWAKVRSRSQYADPQVSQEPRLEEVKSEVVQEINDKTGEDVKEEAKQDAKEEVVEVKEVEEIEAKEEVKQVIKEDVKEEVKEEVKASQEIESDIKLSLDQPINNSIPEDRPSVPVDPESNIIQSESEVQINPVVDVPNLNIAENVPVVVAAVQPQAELNPVQSNLSSVQPNSAEVSQNLPVVKEEGNYLFKKQ
jgi:hypothetical protein